MNRRELLAGAAAILAGVSEAGAFGLGKEGARGGFGRAGAVLGGAGSPFYNINPTTLANTKAAWLAQSANVPIVEMASSVGRGTDESSSPYNAQFGRSDMQILAGLLTAAGTPAGGNNLFASGTTTAADLVLRDGRFAFTGAVGFGSSAVQGGQDISFNAATGTMSFTFPDAVNEAVVVWRDASAGRTFSWAVDGGAATNITSTGTSTIRQNVISLGTLATHTITLAWVLGGATIFGVYAYNNTRKEISCWQWACNGFDTASYVSENGAPNGGRLTQAGIMLPKLAFVEQSPNDWRFNRTVSQAQTSLTTLITALKAINCDVVLQTTPWDGGVAGLTAQQNDYTLMARGLAASMNVGFLDNRKLVGFRSYAEEQAMGTVGLGDGVHPTYSGRQILAAAKLQVLRLGGVI